MAGFRFEDRDDHRTACASASPTKNATEKPEPHISIEVNL